MRMNGNTTFVTGGGGGIGLALAKRFCAGEPRRAEALAAAVGETPALETLQGDVSTEAGRLALVDQALGRFPDLNVLVNNAGIQNRPAPPLQPQDWRAHRTELASNLDAPLHLTMLLPPHFAKRPWGAGRSWTLTSSR